MLKLTPYEQEMLDGKYGRFKQLAMEQTVKFAKVLGAEELIPITKVHLNMGIPPLDYGVDNNFSPSYRIFSHRICSYRITFYRILF